MDFNAKKVDRSLLHNINYALLTSGSWSQKDYHQAVMDAFYGLWQTDKVTGSNEMIATAYEAKPLFALAILVGKFNQQVCNGGAYQYYDNGFASLDGKGCMHNHKGDMRMHENLVKIFEQVLHVHSSVPEVKWMLGQLKRFDVYETDYDEKHELCEECSGTGIAEDPNHDEDNCEICEAGEEHDEPECEAGCEKCEERDSYYYGEYIVEKPNAQDFEVSFNDDAYYARNDEFMTWFNQHIYNELYFEIIRPGALALCA